MQHLESRDCYFHLLKASPFNLNTLPATAEPAEPPYTTLIMIPSASFLLTSFEILLLITNVLLFSYGHPDAARMSLWEEAGANLFNSDPKKRIYSYANHQEPPEIPYI